MTMKNSLFSRRDFIKKTLIQAFSFFVFMSTSDKMFGKILNPDSIGNDLDRLRKILIDEKPQIWLFTGDSITQGVVHTNGHATFAEIFSERIRWKLGRSRDFIINTAISGNTTNHIIDDFEWRVKRIRPSVVFLMIGTNDCSNSKVDVDLYGKNLLKLIKKIRDIKAIPVLLTPCPIDVTKAPERRRIFEYVSKMREIAVTKKVVIIDNWSIWNIDLKNKYGEDVLTKLLNDPIHPNELGHKEIALSIFNKLSISD